MSDSLRFPLEHCVTISPSSYHFIVALKGFSINSFVVAADWFSFFFTKLKTSSNSVETIVLTHWCLLGNFFCRTWIPRWLDSFLGKKRGYNGDGEWTYYWTIYWFISIAWCVCVGVWVLPMGFFGLHHHPVQPIDVICVPSIRIEAMDNMK